MIHSMTAFARSQSQGDWGHAIWECRSVNHRYLDVIVRLPESLRDVEMACRKIAQEKLGRGKVDCILRFQAGPAVGATISLNETLVKSLLDASQKVNQLRGEDLPLKQGDILRWPGVVDVSETQLDTAQQAILNLFEQAVNELIEIRQREGDALKNLIANRIKGMREQVLIVKKLEPDLVPKQREKLEQRLSEVKEQLDPSRLEQELIIYAQRVDIAEELDRLDTHLNEVERVLNKGGVIGRRLDFLMQELNREANTLSSKSTTTDITQAAVEMKVLIEQMREQIQNIE